MFEALKQRLKSAEEGCIAWMYLDSLGYVTVGVGHLLASSAAAVALPFLAPSGVAAGPDAIREEYARVRELRPDELPGYYRERTTLRLGAAAIDELLDGDVEAMHRGLCAALPAVAGFPEAAQDALLDMAFQMGAHGLVTKFPGLIHAAKAGEWAACAAACHSTAAQEARNQVRSELFRQADGATKSCPDTKL